MGNQGSTVTPGFSHFKGGDVVYDTEEIFQTIPGCLKNYALVKGNQDAVVFCSTTGPRQAITWKELYERSHSMAKAFVRFGVKPGESVVITSRTCPEYMYATFGAMMAAVRVVNLVFTYKDGSDFVKMMEKIGNCAAIILDPGVEDSNWEILKGHLDEFGSDGSARSSQIPTLRTLAFTQPSENPHNNDVLTVKSIIEADDDNTIEMPKIDPDGIAVMFQTSGSTGLPKLVAHSHSNITKMRPVMGHAYSGIFFNDRPFAWVGGFPFSVVIGETRVTVSGFCPEPENRVSFLIDVINKERCSITSVFPAGIYELLDRQNELPSDWPLKTIWTGGQPLTKEIAACVGKICTHLGTAYGGTEFLFGACMLVDKQEDLVDYASGLIGPEVEVKIVDKEGAVVPLNALGEIFVRTPFMFKEYLNDPQKTASVLSSDGWYKTDDYGRMNEDGYVFVEGRVSDVIISGAMNVLPSILETLLKKCPGVDSVVIVPVPDVQLYQVVCACVTIKEGSDVTEASLRQYMESVHNDRQKLFTVLPKYYMILDKFPEESNGKLSRKTLKKMAEDKYSA